MPNYKCTKALLGVPYTDYKLCGDGCCDWASDEVFDFGAGEEYDFNDDNAHRAGRCGLVFVDDHELAEHFELIEEDKN